MSNFNQYFKNTGAKIMVERFFNGVDMYSNHKISNLKWHIVNEPEKPASYYIENGLTASHKVQIDYCVNDEKEVNSTYFEVPKEKDGVFIIEGSYRIATSTLGSDYDCRIKLSGTGVNIINFDYNRQYEINKRTLKIKTINQDTGLQRRVKEYKLEEIDKIVGPDKELLKLTPSQSRKFQIKLDIDYYPEYITEKLIQDCLAFGDDRTKDLVIDKKIESVPQGFMNFLFKSSKGYNYFAVRRKIQNHWNKYKKLPDPVNSITLLCVKHWKGTSDNSKNSSEIQVPPGISAMALNAIASKIQVPETVAYNISMSDLIDNSDTPPNGNINKQNALTVSTHVTDDGVLFDVYSKEFQRITIDYMDYLNSKVVASEYVDYETKTLKPNEKGEVEVKYRMRRKMVPVSEIDLIDLHPDYRLSQTCRRIPFLNYSDSVRISMGSGMLKQAIPLPNGERPLVDTGNSEELADNVLNEKFKEEKGVVKEINNKEVIIELPNKDEVSIPRRTAIQSTNDIDVFVEPKVKVGQVVKKGDIITGETNLTTETYKSGINALVLFHAMFGYVHEDAVVVSESFANKMCHYSLIDISIDIKNSHAVKWIAPIGTKVKSGESVMTIYKANRLDEVNRKLQDSLGVSLLGTAELDQYVTEDFFRVPNNIDEAWVSDVYIQEQKKIRIPKQTKKPDYTFAKSCKPYLEDYEKSKDRKIIFDKFPEYVAADTLDEISLSDKSYKTVYTIRVRLIKKTKLMLGSKLTNRYGGKGVISKVLPDSSMPIMVDSKTGEKKTVDVVMNPYSTINRKIPSVLMENQLGLIAHRIKDLVTEYRTTKDGKKKIMPLLEKYYPGRFKDLSVDEFLKINDTKKIEDVYYFNVGSYSTKFTPDLIDEWSDELNVKSQSKILIPQIDVADLNELKENLEPEEYKKAVAKMKGKYTEVDKPLMCGYITMMELYHIPYYSARTTSSLFGIDVRPQTDEPILGHGKYRTTGQVIGEMELSAYLARNAKTFISFSRGDERASNSEFLCNLMGLGMTVQNEAGYNIGGSGGLRDKLGQMKAKFRLKNKK